MKFNGAQLILQCFKEHGVDIIFGYPGGGIMPFYDALYDEKEIKHIITAHEQGATHAADGYARVTGKVGVVVATAGPGATNTVTGIATAYRDSVAMVVLTGQVPAKLIGRDAFQEVNITDITASITKKNYLVTDIKDLPSIIHEAFSIAKEGRPGPVLIDVPKDIQLAQTEYETGRVQLDYSQIEEVSTCEGEALERDLLIAIEAINKCSKPVIYAGGGVGKSEAYEELLNLVEKIKAPITCSLMGIGNFPGNHPYFMGMVGMHGTHCSNFAITHCDLLIAIGVRFSDRVASHPESFAGNAKIIHIDIDRKELGKNVRTEIPLCGDVKKILKIINENIIEKQETTWHDQIDDWKRLYPVKDYNFSLSPKHILNTLYELTEGNAIITTEVGQHQMWTAQYYKFIYPRTFITSGGLGTMGFGLGAAIGASIGKVSSKIINIAGDGSFKMNSIELATIKKYKLPIIQLVFNNHALGMVKQWQDMFFDKRLSFTVVEPDVDFVKLAEAYGIRAMKVSSNSEVRDVLKKALSMNEPVLIEFDINPDNKVMPMVAPGSPIHEIFYEE